MSTTIGDFIYSFTKTEAEAYDVVGDVWNSLNKSGLSRRDHTGAITTIGCLIYLIGGCYPSWTFLGNVDIYHPAQDSWTVGKNIPVARCYITAVSFHSKIFAIGGYNNGPWLTTNREYDSNLNRWTTLQAMPLALKSPTATAIGQQIWVMGGGTSSPKTYIYEILSDSWSSGVAYSLERGTDPSGMMSQQMGDVIWLMSGYWHNGLTGYTMSMVEISKPCCGQCTQDELCIDGECVCGTPFCPYGSNGTLVNSCGNSTECNPCTECPCSSQLST